MLTLKPQLVTEDQDHFHLLNVNAVNFENQGADPVELYIDGTLVKTLPQNATWGFASLTEDPLEVYFDINFLGAEKRLLILKMQKSYD